MSTPTSRQTDADALGSALNEIAALAASGANGVPEPLAKRLLRAGGLAVPRSVLVDGPHHAETARTLRSPLVVKAFAPSLQHKTEVGGVVVGIDDLFGVTEAIAQIDRSVRAAGHEPEGFLVEEQAGPGIELIVGAVRIDGDAWSVLVGLGGIWAEVLDDVGLRVAPLSRRDVREILNGLQGAPLLKGARGLAAVDLGSVEDAVLALAGPAGLLTQLPPEVRALDANPVRCTAKGVIVLDACLVLGEPAEPAVHRATDCDFGPLLAPRSIAVVGASSRRPNLGNAFLARLDELEYDGEVYVVHASGGDVDGRPSVSSLADINTSVDYAYVTLPARAAPSALDGCAGRVRFAQVISSGFGETAEGVPLQHELSRVADRESVRVLGPNCLGVHLPRARVSFVQEPPRLDGDLAFISQSGGLSIDVIRQATVRGIGFRGVVSLGNSSDVRPAELLRWFLADDATSVVGLYLESVQAGIEILDALRGTNPSKPVILLVGGRTASGAESASSHTGALAGNERLWPGIARQAGMVLVDSLEELVDGFELFRFPATRTRRSEGSGVILYGNGGGTSVLASDAFSRAGLLVPRLSADVVRRIEALGLPPGNGLFNPIDVPAASMIVDEGRIVRTIFANVMEASRPQAFVTHVNVGVLADPVDEYDVVDNIVRAVADAHRDTVHEIPHLLVLRPDGRDVTERRLRRAQSMARELEIPVFASLANAITACRIHQDYCVRAHPASTEGEVSS